MFDNCTIICNYANYYVCLHSTISCYHVNVHFKPCEYKYLLCDHSIERTQRSFKNPGDQTKFQESYPHDHMGMKNQVMYFGYL